MALPHYKLHTLNNASLQAQTLFPVLLAPMDPPQKFARLKQFFRSKKLLIALETLSLAAGATLLWLWLDPTIKAPLPVYWIAPSVTLGVCLLLFLMMALARNRTTVTEATEIETAADLPPQTPVYLPRKTPPTVTGKSGVPPAIELDFEQWTSEPFVELIDEAIITEIFDDELIAPDHMVFCVKVPE
ncbi:MAG TPA: hypothetical protein VFZ34_14200 [Blastocatellia bacterium]|nr:hypothetical protein [Blastocatellia bacterium]